MNEIYQSEIKKYEEISDQYKRSANAAGTVKLVLFLLFLASLYYTMTDFGSSLYKLITVALLVIQAAAWIYHSHLNDIIRHAQGIIEVNQRHLMRMDGRWSEFPDIGEEFIDSEHPYGCDLDIVGRKSLFQYINTTHTPFGRQALADDLLHSQYTGEEITTRQEAIAELTNDTRFASELEYLFTQTESRSETDTLAQSLKNPRPFIKNGILRYLLTYLPVLTVILAGAALIFKYEPFYTPAAALIILQAVFWFAGSAAANNYLKGITTLPYRLNAYNDVIELFADAEFSSAELKQMQSTLAGSDVSALQAMKELSKTAGKAGLRNNVISYFILNILLLWDYECSFLFSNWKMKYGPYCEKWFHTLGRLESLLSFAALNNVCSQTCFPQLTHKRQAAAEQLGHPLITNSDRVTNTLNLKDNILIISGSNMSGKTTYLRTVGINIVLARAGAPVCAKSMSCADFQLVTSMRIADDLNEGISTFYAELKRVKCVLDSAKSNPDTLFLIDEIFRGTNSVDRLSGARTVVTRLSRIGVVGMVTTHDLELCDLHQQIPNVRNFSFSENYEDGKICFDYKLRSGKSKTTNAKYLMELVGILSD